MEIKTKAFGFSKYGTKDVFEEKEITIPLQSTKNVLVKVERAGINPVDTLFRSGMMSGGRKLAGFQVLGSEVAGTVEKLYGPVANLQVGDRVIVKTSAGGYASYVSANEKDVFLIPDKMTMDEAGAFSATASTAYWALHGGFYDLKPGNTVAIIGASGSVGAYAVQLAKALSIKIVAVASKKNDAYLRELGADTIIDYANDEQVKEHEKTADFVIDASLFNAGEKVAMTLAKPNGTYLALTTMPDPSLRPDVTRKFLSRTPAMTNQIAMRNLLEFYQKYGLSINVAYALPFTLKGVIHAHELIEEKRNAGKIILSVDVNE